MSSVADKRVAIIGAGPAGLSVLRAFGSLLENGDHSQLPKIVCYEKQGEWGGLWNYTWRTGLDEFGENVHGSMYRYIWSNAPKECLEFMDYSFEEHFGKPIPSYPPREVLRDYITGRLEKSDIRKHILFHHVVRNVDYSDQTNTFTVTVKNQKEDQLFTEEFDFVVVASGHFSVPNVPQFLGFEYFPGRILHSHDFRDAEEFRGKRVLIIGSSYSAEDIGSQVFKYGAKRVVFSCRSKQIGYDWPDGMEELPLLTHLEGNRAFFCNGESREVDAIILCTGYLHSFPFLPESLRLKTKNAFYPPNLYKGVVWQKNEKLFYMGMQNQFYSFVMFDPQAWYIRDLILSRANLPSFDEREQNIKQWMEREQTITGEADAIIFQTDYLRDLLPLSNCPKMNLDHVQDLFMQWKQHKKEGIMTYRDRSYVSAVTNVKAPVHHTPWLSAMDDSMKEFLRDPSS